MTKKEPGYVFILTNPCLREDWVKISTCLCPVEDYLLDMDKNAYPLPFDIYATIQTSKYYEVEMMVVKTIDRITGQNVRYNQNFYNVSPQIVLDVFHDISMMLDDAKITVFKSEHNGQAKSIEDLTKRIKKPDYKHRQKLKRQKANEMVEKAHSFPIEVQLKLFSLSTQEQNAYYIIHKKPGVKAVELTEIMNVSEATARRFLASLIESGLIQHQGSKKSGGYFVVYKE